ncbi:MAG: hypothetical protein PQJ59_05365 [Spirochaetales bacterium]|nr:hypothetical protein [Spirochaetales bacterium]
MGSALVTLMVFLGIIMILRGVLFGLIPYLMKKKNTSPKGDEKEQD